MTARKLFLLGLPLLTLGGCMGVRNEKIPVQREPEPTEVKDRYRPRPVVALEAEHPRPQWPGAPRGRRGEEIDAEVLRAEQARLVSVDLERSGSRIKDTQDKVLRILENVPADPWVAEERDRKAVLYRRWADIATPLPEPEAAAPAAAPAADADEDEGGEDE